ncbi:MAG: PQQ-binding-like beta-propeller repeat protein [Anaerolineae bacterium]|nr:PQQ-binding-like beta-propeller repeat protein [Anaerolineae bacterium]
MRAIFLCVLVLSLLWLGRAQAMAQPQCGVVDSVSFPVDTATFQIMQDFASPSYRHRGWYHTAEDWFGGRGTSFGQPVHAIANGRVTLSSPISWGRDGGVVILEHTFADGSLYYSQYGHMVETDVNKFPQPYSCVRAGDVIGVVGEARPAPHLHFEIRVNNPDLPGPGYTEHDPLAEGYRRPSKMVLNWQTWLSPAHRWHLDLIDEAGPLTPPIALSDESLVYLDTGRVSRVTNDGRVLWRVNLEQRAVALLDAGDQVTIVFATGRMQPVDFDGVLHQAWETGLALAGPPITLDDAVLLPTTDGALVALAPNGGEILWRLQDIPPITDWAYSGGLLALTTQTRELLVVSRDGALLQRDTLDAAGAVSTAPGGRLLAYANGNLLPVEALPVIESASVADGGLLLAAGDGRVFVFDNEVFSAYDAAHQVVWQVLLPGVTGSADLALHEGVLSLVTAHGNIAAVRAADGGLCGIMHVFGDDRAQIWQRLGDDGLLRVAVADQIVGIDWSALIGVCAN